MLLSVIMYFINSAPFPTHLSYFLCRLLALKTKFMWFKFYFAFWWLCFIEIKRPWQCIIHFKFLLRKCLIAYLCFTIILLSGRKPNRKSWGWYVFWWGVVEVLQQSYTHIAGTTFLNLYLNVKCIFDKHGGHRLWPAIYIMYYTVLNLSF